MIDRRMKGEQFRQFKAMGGWKDLQDSVRPWTLLSILNLHSWSDIFSPERVVPQVNTFGVNNPLTALVPSLQDVDPDDAFSSVPYEKGFALLYYLEELMGGPGNTSTSHTLQSFMWLTCFLPCQIFLPEVFMGFVKSYIQLFAYSSVTTDEWKNYLFRYFQEKVRTSSSGEHDFQSLHVEFSENLHFFGS